MSHRNRDVLECIVVAFIVLLTAAPKTASAQEEPSISIEGCVTPGPRAGTFILTEDATGNAVTITGRGELAQHTSNHRERVTGRYSDGDLFVVEQAEHLADSCRPLYERVSERVNEMVSDLRRKAALGFRVGVGLDPELMLLGLHAKFATGVENLVFRPNVEFGLGEVTAEYAANAEAVYLIPFTRESGGSLEVWNIYVGGGPSVSVFNQEFRRV